MSESTIQRHFGFLCREPEAGDLREAGRTFDGDKLHEKFLYHTFQRCTIENILSTEAKEVACWSRRSSIRVQLNMQRALISSEENPLKVGDTH
jgi:hypothetical protein